MTSVRLVGEPCGRSGINTFYKTFGYTQRGDGGLQKTQSIGSFFFVRISAKDDPCIGELQLLWDDGKRHLASVRLYFLPEQTPDGRQPHHGQHEVLAASERVVMRLEDLVEWMTEDVQWDHGLLVKAKEPEEEVITCDPIEKDGSSTDGYQQVLVLSYSNYCRYRAMLSRLNNQVDLWLNNTVALALGIVAVIGTKSHILFCRDTFHHEGLLLHDLNLDHLAPVLKGKTRKRRTKSKRGISPDADSNTSDDSKDGYAKRRPSANGIKTTMHKDEQTFLQKLFKFMKDRRTPILRVPHLGFKQIDLYLFYKKAQKFGGYDQITHKKSWKNIYDEMGGDPGSTSAATCTRKHYERLLLPFERHLKGESNKIMSKSPSSTKMNHAGSMEASGMIMPDIQVIGALSEKAFMKMETLKSCKNEIKLEGMTNEITDTNMELQRNTEEGALKIKLEKLPVHEQHGKTTELWQQKAVSPRKFLSEMVTNKEFKWNEIRKKNAMQRSWARQRKPTRSPNRAEYFQQVLVPKEMHPGKAKVLHLDKMSTNPSALGMQGMSTIPQFPSTMVRPDNSRRPNEFLAAMVKAENAHAFMQHSAKEATKHPTRCEKVNCHSEYPLSVSCPPPRNSDAKSTSAMKGSSRRNSVTCSLISESLELHKDKGNKCFSQNSEVLSNTPSRSDNFSALYSPRVSYKQSETLLEFLSSDRCNRKLPDDKSTTLSSATSEASLQNEMQEATTSHRRPSVILHTEQIRSPPITTPNTIAGDLPLKTSVGLETCSSFYLPTYSEDALMKSLHLRPISGNETKIIDRQFVDLPKFASPSAEAICIKNKLFANAHLAKAKENISSKSSAIPTTMLQDSGKAKKEHGSKASALINRKLQRVNERTTVNTHRHSKPHRASLSNDASFVHAVERTVPAFKNSLLPKSNSPRRFKTSSIEQHRLKHSIPPVLSSPFISSLSRSAHLSYKPSPYINLPNSIPNCSSVENEEVLDLSVKRNEKVKTIRVDRVESSFTEECLDLSVKKKIPSPDTSGLPSGIENITPPPPLTGDENSVTPLPFGCFTPLDSSQFYQRLINNATAGTLKSGIQTVTAPSELITSAAETSGSFVITKSSNSSLYACTPMNYSDKQPSLLPDPSTGTERFITSNPESQLWLQTVLPSRSAADQPSSSTHKESNVPKKLLNSQTFPPQLYPYLYGDKQYYSSVTK